MKSYNIGIYMRLSLSDGDDLESDSISNQRMIIKNYINKNICMCDNIYEYIDDGHTGSNFRRPGFEKMLLDISSEKINMIITKSLSRLGRNYIECGEYVEKLFPDNDIRYIAILDGVDTGKDLIANDFAPIKGILNELYCKETSKNIRASKKRNRIDGLYTCTTAPYGYEKIDGKLGKLKKNKETAPIVEKIFLLKAEGATRKYIAEYLNERNIKTPSQYANCKKQSKYWSVSTVGRILEQENYTGKCISGKTIKLSYKSDKRICIPRNERMCVENTHEAIISQELYDKCHNNKLYGLPRKNRNIHFKLRDFLYCGNCQKKLNYSLMRYDKYSFFCSRNIDSTIKCSNNTRYSYNKIEKLIFDTINECINIENECDTISKKRILSKSVYDKTRMIQRKLKNKEDELNSIKNAIKHIYEKRLSGIISESEYIEKYNKLREEKEDKQNELNALQIDYNSVDEFKNNNKILKKIIKMIKSKGIENFTYEELSMIIDKIYFNKNEICINFKIKLNENISEQLLIKNNS